MINVDRNPAFPKAVAQLKPKDTLSDDYELRPIRYLNNLVEQDHRFIKRRVNPGLGFWSFDTAWRTLQGYEAIHQLRKGQVRGTTRGNIQSQVRFVSTAFGLAAYIQFPPCITTSLFTLVRIVATLPYLK